MAIRIKIGTANTPRRMAPHKRALRWLEDQGADIVLLQENTDNDDWRPSKKRWGIYRPQGTKDHNEAQSNTIYWRRATIKRTKKRGAIRLSSPGFRSYRALVWAHFKVRQGNKPVRVASIHLPAFYTKSLKNKREYDRQAPKVAKWARGGRNRVVGGDFNGTKGNRRMRPIDSAVRLSRPVRSGPKGQKIDYVGGKRGGRWVVVDTVRGPKFDSDHNVVLVTLEWR
jgi:endonuclease/exonuclease/phosphatase family metal-dependent hydrolase